MITQPGDSGKPGATSWPTFDALVEEGSMPADVAHMLKAFFIRSSAQVLMVNLEVTEETQREA
jgi:hypothetical protein